MELNEIQSFLTTNAGIEKTHDLRRLDLTARALLTGWLRNRRAHNLSRMETASWGEVQALQIENLVLRTIEQEMTKATPKFDPEFTQAQNSDFSGPIVETEQPIVE